LRVGGVVFCWEEGAKENGPLFWGPSDYLSFCLVVD
jgi:hypothetical protein